MRYATPFLAALILVFAAGSVSAQEVDGRTSVVHQLGVADAGAAYDLVLEVISPAGRAVLDEGHNNLIVLDTPERQEAVRKALGSLQQPLHNVKVESRIVDSETGEAAQVGASGQLFLSYPPLLGSASAYFDVERKRVSAARSSAAFVVVASGAEASVAVGKEIPYQDWFLSHGRRDGIFSSGTVWKEVGSRLSVRPTVIDGGRKVRLRVVPEFDYNPGNGRKGKNRRVAFAGVATEMVVGNGEEVRVGGGDSNEEFYSRFLVGYDRQRKVRNVDVYIRATVQQP